MYVNSVNMKNKGDISLKNTKDYINELAKNLTRSFSEPMVSQVPKVNTLLWGPFNGHG